MEKKLLLPLFLSLVLVIAGCGEEKKKTEPEKVKDIALIKDGKSAFSIYSQTGAPESVTRAASELQCYIRKTTGANLPIVNEPRSPYISLGHNPEFEKSDFAKETAGKVNPDGFVIATRNGNIYIAGIDTPDGQTSTPAGFSMGTLFGAYDFLEKHLGVRWFMPGAEGERIIAMSNVSVPEETLVDNPSFRWRLIPYLKKSGSSQNDQVEEWALRNRINAKAYGMSLKHYHIWHQIFTPEVYKQHPEYFAEMGGRRVQPLGDRYKICTSNPGVVKLHAQAAIAFFKANPLAKAYSLSPTDSAGYCQCANCRALDEPDRPDCGTLTRRILIYYNEVAKLVKKECPDKYMCGYIYANYLYPPADKSIKLEDNLFLVVASSITYGYKWYHKGVSQDWRKIMDHWSGITRNITYYDLPMHCSDNLGAPLAPGVEILKAMFPALKRYGVKGLYFYGDPEWGHSAMYNYLLARLYWNADLDVDAHLENYFRECYGKGGGELLAMYRLIDRRMKDYYLKNPQASYTLTPDILKTVYAGSRREIEGYYSGALAAAADPSCRRRVEMLGDCLTAMTQFLRMFNMVKAEEKSRFDLSPEVFAAFAAKHKDSLHVPVITQSAKNFDLPTLAVKPYPGKPTIAEQPVPFELRESSHFVIFAPSDDEITVRLSQVKLRSKAISYNVVDSVGKEIVSGNFGAPGEFKFAGNNGQYYHAFFLTSSTSYMVSIDAPHAVDAAFVEGDHESNGLHLLQQLTPLYLVVGENLPKFEITLSSDSAPGSTSGGETAAATLFDPAGKAVAEFSTVEIGSDRKAIKPTVSGVYRLSFTPPTKGAVDDVYVRVDGLGNYVSTDPREILTVRNDHE
jgi:hypothetical protein